MKRSSTSTPNKVSTYYSRLLKLTAVVILIVYGLVAVGTLVETVSYFGFGQNNVSYYKSPAILYHLNDVIILAGGALVAFLATRGLRLSKREVIVYMGTLGVLAFAVYFPLTSFLSVVFFRMVPVGPSVLFALQPVYAVLFVGLLTLILRFAKVSFTRSLMVTFISMYWLTQLWSAFQNVLIATHNEEFSAPSYVEGLVSIAIPLILFAAVYQVIPKIGRAARVFYATLLSSTTTLFSLGLWKFNWDNSIADINSFGLATLLAVLLFLATQIVFLIRIRKKQR